MHAYNAFMSVLYFSFDFLISLVILSRFICCAYIYHSNLSYVFRYTLFLCHAYNFQMSSMVSYLALYVYKSVLFYEFCMFVYILLLVFNRLEKLTIACDLIVIECRL